jgi:hypothetical protein
MPVVTAVTNASTSGPEQLTRGDGGYMGINSTEAVGFYGKTAVQVSGGAQTTVVRGQAAGMVATYATSQNPTSVAANITTEASLTVLITTPAGIPFPTAGDLLYINKPTSQAGLGVGNVRVSTTNVVAMQLSTFAAASVTPTTTEFYGLVAIRGLQNTTITLTPASVAASTTAEQQFTVSGLRAGEVVNVIKPTLTSQIAIVGCRVVTNNTLGITYANLSAGSTAVTPPAEQYTVYSFGGLDALNDKIFVGATYSTPGVAVTAQIVAEQNVNVTGVATTDAVVSMVRQTVNGNLSIANARVSAVNALAVAYVNPSASTTTPTAQEIYALTLNRPNPAAPLITYAQTVTPVSVAANTTAEQALTVTGIVASSMVWVNKPSFTPGLGIVGVRVSGTNSVAVNYCNNTATAITPPSETYLFANFQMALSNGNVWIQEASPQAQQMVQLTNAIRSAMVGMGQIAGA